MLGDGTGETVGEIGVAWVKGQERQHYSLLLVEVFNVCSLGFVTAAGVTLGARPQKYDPVPVVPGERLFQWRQWDAWEKHRSKLLCYLW